jgi:hypothetical protein
MEGNVLHITTGNWDTESGKLYIDVRVCSLDSEIPYSILFHARGLCNPLWLSAKAQIKKEEK